VIALHDAGAWIAGGVGLSAAFVAAAAQIRQAHIAALPGAQSVAADLYQGLFADLHAEIARLHEDMAASRAAEEECRGVTSELRARIGVLEQMIGEMTQ